MNAVIRPPALDVLLVDDEFLFAFMLQMLIEEGGRYRVVGTASDRASALALAQEHHPAFALVDLRLKHDESGLDAAKALEAAGVPCLLMSGYPPDARPPGVALGCLSKPFRTEALKAALATVEAILTGRPTIDDPPQELQLY